MTLKNYLLVFFLTVWAGLSHAGLTLEITQGQIKPFPLAVMDFKGDESFGKKISEVIRNNLKKSGFFDIIDPNSYIQTDLKVKITPRFEDWKLLRARALAVGEVNIKGKEIEIFFQLWDTYSETLMGEFSFKSTMKYWRRVAHLASDMIYKRITGEEGYFDTRIVYVSETGSQGARQKRLALMDQDGERHYFITKGDIPIITPRFSPNSQKITYMSYDPKNRNLGKVYILDLETGEPTLVGKFQGITYAPRFSPTGEEIILSQAIGGNSSLYVMNLVTGKTTRLTNEAVIDTSPCYSPEGDKIVFNSDRGGTPQIYLMNKDGSDIKRISFGGGSYATPVWSPRGNLIAFTKVQEGQFYIGIMNPDGSEERLIAKGFLVEGPTWAPNGRTIAFYRQDKWEEGGEKGGRARLCSVDITGYNEQELVTPQDASDPAWSPSLPLMK